MKNTVTLIAQTTFTSPNYYTIAKGDYSHLSGLFVDKDYNAYHDRDVLRAKELRDDVLNDLTINDVWRDETIFEELQNLSKDNNVVVAYISQVTDFEFLNNENEVQGIS